MKRLFLLLLLVCGFSLLGNAQGVSYPGTPMALTHGGFPVAGATVTVCSGNVAVTLTASPPCSPYATIYSDPALIQPITQPGFKTDGNGNYPFFVAASATYTVVITGSGLTGTSTVWTSPILPTGNVSISTQALNGIRFADQYAFASTTCGIQEAFDSLLGSPGAVVAPPSYSCALATGFTVSHSGQYLDCSGGQRTTTLSVTPAFTGTLATFSAGAAVLYQTGIKGCRFDGTGNTNSKTVINARDTSSFKALDIAIANWTGGNSIGVLYNGRELPELSGVIYADRPIVISENPNFASIDLDHARFRSLNLTCSDATQSAIYVTRKSENSITNTSTDITNWNLSDFAIEVCTKGIDWNEPTPTQRSISISWRHGRTEQHPDNGDYAFTAVGNIQDLLVEDVNAGVGTLANRGGFRTNAVHATFINTVFAGVNATNTCFKTDDTVTGGFILGSMTRIGAFCGAGSTRDIINVANNWQTQSANYAGTRGFEVLVNGTPPPVTVGTVLLKDVAGNLHVRDSGDASDVSVYASIFQASGGVNTTDGNLSMSSGYFHSAKDFGTCWSSTTAASGTFDTCIARYSAGVVRAVSGTSAGGGDGFFRASTYTSTAATGTAPLVVASTTNVPNLNADTVDGKHVGAASAGHATCWKADALTIGYCSDVVAAGGTCTCN